MLLSPCYLAAWAGVSYGERMFVVPYPYTLVPYPTFCRDLFPLRYAFPVWRDRLRYALLSVRLRIWFMHHAVLSCIMARARGSVRLPGNAIPHSPQCNLVYVREIHERVSREK